MRPLNSISRKGLAAILMMVLLLASCRKEDIRIYDVNPVDALPVNTDKNQLKTEEQYIAILYSNLFQKALSANDLFDILQVIESVGDKETVHEVILSSFMNAPDKIIPDETTMRANLDQFIFDTYKRFYVREPSPAEVTWFRNFISADQNITPELVYLSFALSNEYLYY